MTTAAYGTKTAGPVQQCGEDCAKIPMDSYTGAGSGGGTYCFF